MLSSRGVLVLVLLAGCRQHESARGAAASERNPRATGAADAPSSTPSARAAEATCAEAPPRKLRRCFPDSPPWLEAPVADLLDRASVYYGQADYDGALSCAEEAARQAPRSVEAHHDRALAFLNLGRLDEARDAMTLALALGPEDPETLEAAADLFINHLSPSSEHSTIGLEYARRGGRRAPRRDRAKAARLALLEGQALVDLGHSGEALHRIDVSLLLQPANNAARYERGVALFELCRFSEARRVLSQVQAAAPEHAHAIFHLALIDEREGRDAAAARGFAESTRLDPTLFPPALVISPERFAERVRVAVAALPDSVKADLGNLPVELAEIPQLEDLTAESPPLSPTILGLFRGLPLGGEEAARRMRAKSGSEDGTPAGRRGAWLCIPPDRAIIVYRRNLLRTVRSEADLDQAIGRTLLHEAGHLRGEDDGSLRDRGLE